ncbi:hypothetical protein ACFSCX_20315 [Bacillus salitolerans]|uniref:Uncharacterized protein n=1 Tax=Bacillus salitolerans TaxID=1437434 RepID=A0ABW4LUQ8_9BACI
MQDRLLIGDKLIQWGSLRESQDRKDVILIKNGIVKNVGTTYEKISYLSNDGFEFIQREQVLTSDVLGDRKGITVVEKNSFKPISYTSYSNGKVDIKTIYFDEKVQITKKSQEKYIYLTDKEVFDSFSVEMILRVLPLEVGYMASLNAFKTPIESEIKITVEVVGKELINNGEDILLDSWKLKTYFGETFQYYWVSEKSKELLKQSSQIEDGVFLEFIR